MKLTKAINGKRAYKSEKEIVRWSRVTCICTYRDDESAVYTGRILNWRNITMIDLFEIWYVMCWEDNFLVIFILFFYHHFWPNRDICGVESDSMGNISYRLNCTVHSPPTPSGARDDPDVTPHLKIYTELEKKFA